MNQACFKRRANAADAVLSWLDFSKTLNTTVARVDFRR